MDVAHYAVMFLFQYFSNRNEWTTRWQAHGAAVYELIRAALGRNLSASDVLGSHVVGATEYEIRQVIISYPNFGQRLRDLLMQDPFYAKVLVQDSRLYDVQLAGQQHPNEEQSYKRKRGLLIGTIVVAVIVLCLCIGAIVSLTH